jgi:hypothetical protein
MSTRGNVIIKYGNTKVVFYRHHDNYISEGGYELATLIKHNVNAPALIKDMLTRQRGIYIYDMDRPLYKLCSALAGDSEYTYTLTFGGDYLSQTLQIKVVNHAYDAGDITIYSKSGMVGAVADDFYKYCSKEHMKAFEKSYGRAS